VQISELATSNYATIASRRHDQQVVNARSQQPDDNEQIIDGRVLQTGGALARLWRSARPGASRRRHDFHRSFSSTQEQSDADDLVTTHSNEQWRKSCMREHCYGNELFDVYDLSSQHIDWTWCFVLVVVQRTLSI